MTEPPPRWTAIVLAGQRPGRDKLAAHFGETYKALVNVGGEAMITRVVRTLNATPEVARIVVLAQDPKTLECAVLKGGGATVLTSNSGISASIKAVAGTADAPWPVLVTTADHPLLTPAFVSGFLRDAGGGDLGVGMVERATVLAAYPDNKRTWLRFSDGDWSGANLFTLNGPKVSAALDLWAAAEQDRKKAWKLFMHFGPWLAFRAITRTIGLREAFARAGQRLGLDARLIALADAETAIDVDKVSDHELAEEILSRRDA